MESNHRVNWQITHSKIMVISAEGSNLGVMTKDQAISEAKKQGLDLVQFSGEKSDIPVCKMVDYGKIKYQESKKQKKSHIFSNDIKEMRIGCNISQHDLEIKNRKVIEFLKNKHKVNYVLFLRANVNGNRIFTHKVNTPVEASEMMRKMLDTFSEVAEWSPIKQSGGPEFSKWSVSTTLTPKHIVHKDKNREEQVVVK
jgi:translation initiation factor IF-3